MNQLKTIKTEYLRPSRTIETVLVSNRKLSEVIFVYNYEGISFRVFESHLKLMDFFQDKCESDYHFSTENELDGFLFEFKLVA